MGYSKAKKKGLGIDDLSGLASQNAMRKFLSKHKKAVTFVVVFILLLIADILLTFGMAFGLI